MTVFRLHGFGALGRLPLLNTFVPSFVVNPTTP